MSLIVCFRRQASVVRSSSWCRASPSRHTPAAIVLGGLDVPADVLIYIFGFLPPGKSRTVLHYVSQAFNSVALDPSLWRHFGLHSISQTLAEDNRIDDIMETWLTDPRFSQLRSYCAPERGFHTCFAYNGIPKFAKLHPDVSCLDVGFSARTHGCRLNAAEWKECIAHFPLLKSLSVRIVDSFQESGLVEITNVMGSRLETLRVSDEYTYNKCGAAAVEAISQCASLQHLW